MAKIWLDVMWWDNVICWKTWVDPRVIWWLNALKLAPELKLYLFWNEELIRHIISIEWYKVDNNRLDFVNTDEWKEIDSLIRQIKTWALNWWVSAGDTWKLIKESLRLWRLEYNWVKFSPALTSFMPKQWGWQTLILDLWASSAWYKNSDDMINSYINNALLALSYYKSNWNENPKIWIFNIGTEEYKWPKTLQDVYKEFRERFWYDFVWNVEWDKVFTTEADIIVTDWFTWNMILKSLEWTVKFLSKEVESSILKSKVATLLALLMRPYLKSLKNQYNPDKYSGSPILGVNWNIFKSHWSSNSTSIANALIKADEFWNRGDLYMIKENLDVLTKK